MKANQLKLFKYWKNNNIISYHSQYINESFRVKNINHISLKFLNSCWIKKWNSLEELKNTIDITNTITISIGGNFINNELYSSLLKEQQFEKNLVEDLNFLTQIIYIELYIVLNTIITNLNNATIINN